MEIVEFRRSFEQDAPPAGLAPALEALWWDGKGDWDKAHERAQADSGADGAWVHAYLHRKEGDLANAGYWYREAGRAAAQGPLEAEWAAIAAALLGAERD
ncbi:hypothetical protein [Desertibaculum subflavum]|uniref:hypothetical protein n=1 Tax=Desertibaculum subflavum TaxID=2268458 RepID=UPI000E6761EA